MEAEGGSKRPSPKPRDPQVLNLLGIVYFKQDKLGRAEEVYRKLLAESPEAHTLYYNLGLIYLKLGRLEEAEPAFLKALEASPPITRRSTTTSARSTSAYSATRTPSTSIARPARAGWCSGCRAARQGR